MTLIRSLGPLSNEKRLYTSSKCNQTFKMKASNFTFPVKMLFAWSAWCKQIVDADDMLTHSHDAPLVNITLQPSLPMEVWRLQCSVSALTLSWLWHLCGGGLRVIGWVALLEVGMVGTGPGDGSDRRLGSCFTRMAVKSWLNAHMPSVPGETHALMISIRATKDRRATMEAFVQSQEKPSEGLRMEKHHMILIWYRDSYFMQISANHQV